MTPGFSDLPPPLYSKYVGSRTHDAICRVFFSPTFTFLSFLRKGYNFYYLCAVNYHSHNYEVYRIKKKRRLDYFTSRFLLGLYLCLNLMRIRSMYILFLFFVSIRILLIKSYQNMHHFVILLLTIGAYLLSIT